MIKLNIFKNSETEKYQCPVSLKDFTDSTKIVAIRTTGNVYSSKVVDELNKKQKNWYDLITGKKFKAKDIIVLQDPLMIKHRIIDNFLWRKEGKNLEKIEDDDEEKLQSIDMPGLGKRALEQAGMLDLKDSVIKKLKNYSLENGSKKKIDKEKLNPDDVLTVKEFIEERKILKDWRHEMQSTGKVAASVTSSYISVKLNEEKRILTDAEMLQKIWIRVKSHHIKTYLQIKTNLGILNCVLYSHQAARTCFSFLDMVYSKKLDGLRFGKLVQGTIVQVGNKGRNLRFDTVDKSEKLKHDQGGLLTIESSGKVETLGVTLSRSTQLNYNYSVFGKIVGGFDIIKSVSDVGNADPVEEGMEESGQEEHEMKADFRIEGIEVFSDAFQEACRGIRRELLGITKKMQKDKEDEIKKEKRRNTLNKILML